MMLIARKDKIYINKTEKLNNTLKSFKSRLLLSSSKYLFIPNVIIV